MIERIQEQNVWDFLKNDSKPVVLYGMGLGAEKIMDTLSIYGVTVDSIFASDEFVRGHSFRGFRVMKYSEVCAQYEDFNVVLCFASRLDGMILSQRTTKHLTSYTTASPTRKASAFIWTFWSSRSAEK